MLFVFYRRTKKRNSCVNIFYRYLFFSLAKLNTPSQVFRLFWVRYTWSYNICCFSKRFSNKFTIHHMSLNSDMVFFTRLPDSIPKYNCSIVKRILYFFLLIVCMYSLNDLKVIYIFSVRWTTNIAFGIPNFLADEIQINWEKEVEVT